MLSITLGKVYFIISGYSVQLLLPRMLGTPERFGLYSAAMGVVSILTNVLIVATIQSVSKQVSGTDAPQVRLREALRIQLALGGILGGGLFFGADTLATTVLLDTQLAPLFRIAAGVVFAYALYAAIIGFLNGQQKFQHQAMFDLAYTTVKTGGILGAAALGFGVVGAIAGFASAAFSVLMVALFTVGIGQAASPEPNRAGLPLKRWAAFMAPLFLYHLCLNLMLQVDLALLKRTVAELALQTGDTQVAAAEMASRFAGFYRGAQTFSFVPYQLILSVAFVVFPMISHASALGDAELTRNTIMAANRFSLLVLCAIAAPVSGASAGVLRIAYPDAYLAGAGALSVLAFGMAAFALFVIGATTLSGAGLPQVAAGIAVVSVGVVIAANLTFVPIVGLDGDVMWAAACSTSTGTTVALVLCAITVYRRFGAFIAPLSVIRACVAATLAFLAARNCPHDTAPWALVALVTGTLSFLLALILTGELGRDDLQAVRKIIRPRP